MMLFLPLLCKNGQYSVVVVVVVVVVVDDVGERVEVGVMTVVVGERETEWVDLAVVEGWVVSTVEGERVADRVVKGERVTECVVGDVDSPDPDPLSSVIVVRAIVVEAAERVGECFTERVAEREGEWVGEWIVLEVFVEVVLFKAEVVRVGEWVVTGDSPEPDPLSTVSVARGERVTEWVLVNVMVRAWDVADVGECVTERVAERDTERVIERVGEAVALVAFTRAWALKLSKQKSYKKKKAERVGREPLLMITAFVLRSYDR